jgi:hypothetical protein
LNHHAINQLIFGILHIEQMVEFERSMHINQLTSCCSNSVIIAILPTRLKCQRHLSEAFELKDLISIAAGNPAEQTPSSNELLVMQN